MTFNITMISVSHKMHCEYTIIFMPN